jgi:hypothetical protein
MVLNSFSCPVTAPPTLRIRPFNALSNKPNYLLLFSKQKEPEFIDMLTNHG